jgi:hypothetical protein
VIDLAAIAMLTLVIAAVFRNTSLGYDGSYSLTWGADLLQGRRVQYDVLFAPTPHPLAVTAGAFASLFGRLDYSVLFVLEIACVAAVGVGLYRLGAVTLNPLVGLLAAAIALTRVPFVEFGVQGTADMPTLALIVWAAVLEARTPRRGLPVVLLLTLAGLMRPEAWLLSFAYWLWLAPVLGRRDRVRLALIALIAPCVWAATDALATGDPLWSLHGTRDFGVQLDRHTGLADLPQATIDALRHVLGVPVLVVAAAGIAGCLLWLRRRVAVPLALLAANAVTFLLLAIAGLPLVERYLFTACAMLALFAAAGLAGWTVVPPPPGRRA